MSRSYEYSHVPQPDAKRIAQILADAFDCIAYNNDHAIADGRGAMYVQTERALLAAIRQAYGMTALMAHRVRDVMIDGGEDVEYSASYVRTHRTSNAYEH